ncbi:MAG: 4Fe-4S binding protein [Bacteroidota bacterium]|nr:4Fe-4S binding protein [Bacteroidota bacterium]MDP4205619.1 4Fe-4S binding protein [Bacteroidota bacterium]
MSDQTIKRRNFLKKCTGLLGVVGVAAALSSWDIESGERKRYRVDNERCVGCKRCVSVCKHKGISVVKKFAVIDQKRCISCGDCAEACPRKAIV